VVVQVEDLHVTYVAIDSLLSFVLELSDDLDGRIVVQNASADQSLGSLAKKEGFTQEPT
jgi:hypothetical protein